MMTNLTDTTATQIVKIPLSALIMEMGDILFQLRWFIFAAVVLILSDLWFGISVSKKKGEEIRRSSAARKTINKFIDYLLYVVLGTTLAMAIAQSWGINPVYIASAILLLCYAFEIDSIYSHICYLHGVKKKISIFKVVWLLITGRFSEIHQITQKVEESQELAKTLSTNKNKTKKK